MNGVYFYQSRARERRVHQGSADGPAVRPDPDCSHVVSASPKAAAAAAGLLAKTFG